MSDSSVSSRELSCVAWDTLGALCSFVPAAFLGRTRSLGTAGEEPQVAAWAQGAAAAEAAASVVCTARGSMGPPGHRDPSSARCAGSKAFLSAQLSTCSHHFHTQPSRVRRCVPLGQRRGEFPLPGPLSNPRRLTAAPSSPTRLRPGKDVVMDCNVCASAVTPRLGPFTESRVWEGLRGHRPVSHRPAVLLQHL